MCPYCNSAKLQVAIATVPEESQNDGDDVKISARKDSHESTTACSDTSVQEQAPETGGFGSYLAQNERVALMRARSSSMASDHSGSAKQEDIGVEEIAAFAMTAEERSALEAEMRAQKSHPLAQRLEQEEAERRLRNEQEYYRSQSRQLQELRARREQLVQTLGQRRSQRSVREPILVLDPSGATRSSSSSGQDRNNWDRLLEAFENGRSQQSLDDLVVLEAAIMLSMQEQEANRRDNENEGDGQEDGDAAGNSGLLGFARSSRARPDDNNLNSLLRSLQSRRARRDRPYRHASEATLDTAALLMRGISEEEQIAMAIAASLSDQNAATAASNDGEGNNEENEQDTAETEATADGEAVGDVAESTPSSEEVPVDEALSTSIDGEPLNEAESAAVTSDNAATATDEDGGPSAGVTTENEEPERLEALVGVEEAPTADVEQDDGSDELVRSAECEPVSEPLTATACDEAKVPETSVEEDTTPNLLESDDNLNDSDVKRASNEFANAAEAVEATEAK